MWLVAFILDGAEVLMESATLGDGVLVAHLRISSTYYLPRCTLSAELESGSATRSYILVLVTLYLTNSL